MARGNALGPRGGGSSRGGRGGSRGRGGGRGRGRYVGAAYAASLAPIRENTEHVFSDIANVSSPSVSGGFNLRRHPTTGRPHNNWFGPVTGTILLKYFKCSVDSPESYQFQNLNSSEANPDGVAFAIVDVNDQPLWTKYGGIVYTNSRLHLLPDYAKNKAALLSQHQEATEKEKLRRIIDATTEDIKFHRYGLEDGPDMETYDPHGNVTGMIVPGEWQKKKYENPILAGCNNTASLKYTPGPHSPIAVFEIFPGDDRAQFILWFRIEEIELFAANSAALVEKFHQIGLNGAVDTEWAALKLSRVLPGDPQYRRHPSWRKTEKSQYGLGREKERLGSVENKCSDEEDGAGERETKLAEQLVAGEEARGSEETGVVEGAGERIAASLAEMEEEELAELVRVLAVDERMQALVEKAKESLRARVEDVEEEEEEEE
ncbi:hypothetical protein QBC41DRAFT_304720 [Cercophora samala]|uniref:Uncharacterized protein n=1 Tax=Cercophora samala TaxID=330535 RepID=A0AA40D9Q8_9PEZI|nr:hypothetical protein QBC41DRAFT_304720 [Cercophora samala]